MDFVCAVDGSAPSDRALAHAVELAKPTDATVTAVHSVDPSLSPAVTRGEQGPSVDGDAVVATMSDATDRGERIAHDAQATAAEEHEFVVATDVLYGDPIDTLPAYADGADDLFVGHRGRSDRHGDHLGSVASALVERADVSVTVVG